MAVCIRLGDDRFYRVNPADTFRNTTMGVTDDFSATKTKETYTVTKSVSILHILSDVNRR